MKLVSPYLVLGEEGVAFFSAMAASGVKVTMLTNSLEATDVVAVHAGYAKRRKALLEAGVALFELKKIWPAPAPVPMPLERPALRNTVGRRVSRRRRFLPGGRRSRPG
jgi:phosphatidylserine/phosphatidylglycerophosphate/cardiolipin synthase-like enzyme